MIYMRAKKPEGGNILPAPGFLLSESFVSRGRLLFLPFSFCAGSGALFLASASDQEACRQRGEDQYRSAESKAQRAGTAGIRQNDTGIVYRVEGVRKVVVFAQSLIISKKMSAALSSLL